MPKQTEIKYISQRGDFVQNVNQISEQNKQNKHWDAKSKEVLPDVLKKILLRNDTTSIDKYLMMFWKSFQFLASNSKQSKRLVMFAP
jgi:flagellar hook-associated protein FlgK